MGRVAHALQGAARRRGDPQAESPVAVLAADLDGYAALYAQRRIISLRQALEYRADVGGGMTEHEVVDIFMAQADANLTVRPNPDEVHETKWIGFYDLCAQVERRPKQFTPWLRIYLSDHKDRLFASMMRL